MSILAAPLVRPDGNVSVPTEGMTTTPRNPLAGTVYTETLRGVRCVRLSVMTDETTSPERQREAVDLDVSASAFGPFDGPQLGGWLARPDDFDALAWWRFDRAIRSMAYMHELAAWAREHRKMLVFTARPRALVGACGGARCARCGSLILADVVDVDHVQPLALGGEDTDGNVQILCRDCHLIKTGEDFPLDATTSRAIRRAPRLAGREPCRETTSRGSGQGYHQPSEDAGETLNRQVEATAAEFELRALADVWLSGHASYSAASATASVCHATAISLPLWGRRTTLSIRGRYESA